MDFGVWEREELPDIIFVLYSDLEMLEAITKNHFSNMHKVVLCSDLHAEKLVQKSKPGVYATIVGPITSSKVCAAILSRPETLENGHSAYLNPSNGSIAGSSTNGTDESRCENEVTAASPIDHTGGADLGQVDGPAEKELPDRTVAKAPEQPTEPRFLLVDDNNINLKVIGMYAKKCSKRPSASAAGGQEAIDAFKLASLAPSHNQDPANKFDIILLDLSMPEVSGFDVAAAVRKFEQENGSSRTYIAALTGLVSDKDRAAAFAAGVDEYVTKPATLKDVQGVVASWRATLEAPP
jgi:CheY-like chemotaxis protein